MTSSRESRFGRQVRESVAQMGELVDTLLALSRLQAADPALQMSEADVGDLVSDAVATLAPWPTPRACD